MGSQGREDQWQGGGWRNVVGKVAAGRPGEVAAGGVRKVDAGGASGPPHLCANKL